jgi:addiction module HigA family antidote
MKTEDLRKRLRKDRPMRTISLRMPEDVAQDLKRIARRLGLSGYLPLLRAYVGQGLGGDLARFEGTDNPASASTHERAGNPRPVRRRQPVHPGEILREDVLPGLHLSVAEAARQLRVTRQRLDRILSGRSAVTAEMALRLGRFCSNGPDLWLGMQRAHDLWHARERLGAELDQIPELHGTQAGDERARDTDYVSQALRYAAGLAEEQVIPAEPIAS